MSFELHTVDVLDGSTLIRQDRLILARLDQVANASGATSAAVTTAISGLSLPNNYIVLVECPQTVFVTVTSKTNSGFNVVLTPLTGNAVSAGHFNVLVVA